MLCSNIHHIACDGWSMGVMITELAALYEAHSSHRPAELSEPPIRFTDFAVWEREGIRGANLERLLDYWRSQMAGAPAALPLPTDYQRPSRRSYRGNHHPLTLSPAVTASLRALARREAVTLHTLLLAAFATLLSRYAGQDDMVIGSTFANRRLRQVESLIGYFANTLPIRVRLSGRPSFDQVMQRVHKTSLAVAAHQELPFAKLVSELQARRDPSRTPLFQVVFDVLTRDHNPAVYGYGMSSPVAESLRFGGVTASPEETESRIARFDIAVFIWDMPGALSGAVEFSTDLFRPSTIARMFEDFESLLRAIVADPDAPIKSLLAQFDASTSQLEESRSNGQKDYRASLQEKLKGMKGRSADRDGAGAG